MVLIQFLRLFFFLYLFTLQPILTFGQSPHETLTRLIEDEWQFRLKEFPLFASSVGVHQYDDQLPEVSIEAQEKRKTYWQQVLKKMESINYQALSPEDQLNFDYLKFVLEDDVSGIAFETYLVPINSEGSFHSGFAFMLNSLVLQDTEDYQHYLARLRQFPAYARAQMEMMKLGIKKGKTVPQVVLNGFEETIDPYLVEDPATSIFYQPFKQMPGAVSSEEQKRLKAEGLAAIRDDILPAYQAFRDFLVNEYRPQAMKEIGVTNWPDGQAYYEQRIRFFTTLAMTPDEVFNIGLQEVGRIENAMQAIIDSLDYDGTFADFIAFLRSDPQFYPTNPEQLLKEASFLAKQIDGKLPMLFNRLPRLPYGVEPVPAAIAPKYTGGRYKSGSIENHQAGAYWVNTTKLDSRPLYLLPSLTLHEAVPGHHLQISLSQELEGLPDFRKHGYLSAFGEGWGLYAEFLGQELGMYQTPYEDFGRLTYEMWRACRLVVDVGMHAKGWSREKAVDYLASHTALSLHEVNTEIDRYIGWPGQAVSYKIGEMKIRALRKKAEAVLGNQFDVRVFHDKVLQNGSVPLFILEDQIDEYLHQTQP